MQNCGVCEHHRSASDQFNYEIVRTTHWVFRHHPAPAPLLGWLLLDSRRHLSGPIDFQPDEAASWGKAMQIGSGLVQRLTKCDRVYAIAFGEGAHHLHLHLIPRFQLDLHTTAWAVADHYRSVSNGQRVAVDSIQIAEFVKQARLLAKSFEL